MKKNRANITKKAGLPPESLVYTGNRKPSPAEIELLVYDQESCRKLQITNPAELSGAIDINKVNLLILNNITDVTLIENLGKHFGPGGCTEYGAPSKGGGIWRPAVVYPETD